MKKILLWSLAGMLMIATLSSCAPRKTAGYVSKVPNHHRHPCDH